MQVPDIWEMLTGSLKPNDEEDVSECDYDIDCIPLYESIAKREWEHVRDFIATGKWHNNFFQSTFLSSSDPIPPKKQARTWVTKYEFDDKNQPVIMWTRLPLHAAIIFGAPKDVIEALLQLYPTASSSATEKTMLPLHLAIKHGANDDVLRVLLKSCQEAITPIMDANGRFPSTMEGPRADLQKTIEIHVEYASTILKKNNANSLEKAQKEFENELKQLDDFVKKREKRNEATKRACKKADQKIESYNKRIDCAKEEVEAAKKDLVYQKSRIEMARIQMQLNFAREDALAKQSAAANAAAASHSVIGNHWVSEKEFAKKDQIYQKAKKKIAHLESELKAAKQESHIRQQEANVAAASVARAASSVASVASSKATKSAGSSKASKSADSSEAGKSVGSKASKSAACSRGSSSKGSGSQEELISTTPRKADRRVGRSRKSRNRASPIRTIHVVHQM